MYVRQSVDRQRLREAIHAAVAAAPASPGGVVRAAVTVSGPEPMDWLAGLRAGDRTFWRSRAGALTVAAAGAAVSADVDDPLQLAPHIASLPAGAVAFVTGRFDAAAVPASEWEPFGRVRLVLPRLERRDAPDMSTLACYISHAERDDPDRVVDDCDRLAWPGLSSGDGQQGPGLPVPAVREGARRIDQPDYPAWESAVRHALSAFDRGGLEKVVLARRSAWALPTSVGPIQALRAVVGRAPGCFQLLVERGDSAFLSITPERLFRISRGRIVTEAVAATLPGDDPDADFGGKERREHALVVEDVLERLAPLVHDVEAGAEPRVMQLARRRHLHTRIAGNARDGVSALDVLAALHPTPAVGGHPRETARDLIRASEGFDRGLYGGFVGRIGRDKEGRELADFAVGIRSALLTPRDALLYAGAGIVPGSDPGSEWAEVDGKMSDLALALGLP